MHKGSISLVPVLVVFFSLVAFLGVMYLAFPVTVRQTVEVKNLAPKQKTTQPTLVTFENPIFRYSVQYRSDWQLLNCDDAFVKIASTKTTCASADLAFIFTMNAHAGSTLTQSQLATRRSSMIEPEEIDATVGGISGKRLRGQLKPEAGSETSLYNDTVYVTDGQRVYEFGYNADGVIGEDFQTEFERFLQSVKFLPPTRGEAWGMYTNREYGFAFSFPPNFSIGQTYPDTIVSIKDDGTYPQDGAITASIVPALLDPTNITDVYGQITTPEKVSMGTQTGYAYMIGDAGCGAYRVVTAIGNQTLKISFSGCVNDVEGAPSTGEPLYTQKALIAEILATYRTNF